MINLKSLSAQVASAAFFFACTPAIAQWQVPDNAVAIGRGTGQGFKNVPMPSGSLLIGQTGIPQAIVPTGDITINTSGVTAIGTAKVTNAMLAAAVDIAHGGTNATTAAGARTNLGLAIGSQVQAWDTDLDAFAALASNGLVARTGAGSVAARTITGSNGAAISNGDGIAGNPAVSVDINGLTADAAPDGAADYVMTYDASAGVNKKVLLNNMPGGGGGGGVTNLATDDTLYGGPVTSTGTIGLQMPLMPQGRISLTADPVMQANSASATSIGYRPFVGNRAPIFNGTNLRNYLFTSSATDTTGLSITLGSNWAANTIFDVFVGLNGGVVTLCTGPAYTTSTAGAGNRSAVLATYLGLQVNAASMTCRLNNTTTFTCAQYQCTWLGAFLTSGSAGQVAFNFGTAAAGGGAAMFSVCNAYNQVPTTGRVVDTTATWINPTASGMLNNSAGNRVSVVSCNGTMPLSAEIYQRIQTAANGAVAYVALVMNGTTGQSSNSSRGLMIQSTAAMDQISVARADEVPPLGLNYIQVTQFNSGSQTFVGTSLDQRLVASWQY